MTHTTYLHTPMLNAKKLITKFSIDSLTMHRVLFLCAPPQCQDIARIHNLGNRADGLFERMSL